MSLQQYPQRIDPHLSFKFVGRNKDSRDHRGISARIRRALAKPEKRGEHRYRRDIETGIHMMLLCAGRAITYRIPLHLLYLSAMQHVEDYHAELIPLVPEEVDRTLALIRAGLYVEEALSKFGERRPTVKQPHRSSRPPRYALPRVRHSRREQRKKASRA